MPFKHSGLSTSFLLPLSGALSVLALQTAVKQCQNSTLSPLSWALSHWWIVTLWKNNKKKNRQKPKRSLFAERDNTISLLILQCDRSKGSCVNNKLWGLSQIQIFYMDILFPWQGHCLLPICCHYITNESLLSELNRKVCKANYQWHTEFWGRTKEIICTHNLSC